MPKNSYREEAARHLFASRDSYMVLDFLLGFEIDPPEPFFANDIAHELDLSTGIVHRLFGLMYEVEAIQIYSGNNPVEYINRGQKPIWYERCNPAFWDGVDLLLEHIQETG